MVNLIEGCKQFCPSKVTLCTRLKENRSELDTNLNFINKTCMFADVCLHMQINPAVRNLASAFEDVIVEFCHMLRLLQWRFLSSDRVDCYGSDVNLCLFIDWQWKSTLLF